MVEIRDAPGHVWRKQGNFERRLKFGVTVASHLGVRIHSVSWRDTSSASEVQ